MTPDLTYLVWSVALAFAQVLIMVPGAMGQVGLDRLASNRENMPELEGWVGRARRAHANMIENLVMFAVLVLVAHVAGKANAMTALGAALFFWARLAYAIVYMIGIPWLRTGIWSVSIIGMILIFLQIVG